jgi:hypothetical protein
MENLIFLLMTSFAVRLSPAKKLKNYKIGDTGCTALLFPGNHGFDRTTTTTGDLMYFHESRKDDATYGIICIQLLEKYGKEEASHMLSSYIGKLKEPFSILHQTGIQDDMDWNTDDSITFVDYWQDQDQKDWKVKGYTNGEVMAILYVQNISHVAASQLDHFLDSFHFKAA